MKKYTKTRRKFVIWTFMMLMMLCLGACSAMDNVSAYYNYSSELLNIRMSLPKSWDNEYLAVETAGRADFYRKHTDGSRGEIIFSILRRTGECIGQEDLSQFTVPEKLLMTLKGYTYSVQYPYGIPGSAGVGTVPAEVSAFYEDVPSIVEKMDVSSAQPPQATSSNFKIVGSLFFTMEIPDYLKFAEDENQAMTWHIIMTDTVVGKVRMIPFNSGKEIKNSGEVLMSKVLREERLKREFLVTFLNDHIEPGNFYRICETFRFLDGPFCVGDFMTEIRSATAAGGQLMFGEIQEVHETDGRVTMLEFDELKSVPQSDGTVKLQKMDSFSLQVDEGTKIAPLLSPELKRLGNYHILNFSDFYRSQEYASYEPKYFYILKSSKGVLKFLLGNTDSFGM